MVGGVIFNSKYGDNGMKKIWVYAEQWGIFWRFKPEIFEKLLKTAIQTGYYDLDECGLYLRGQPKAIRKHECSGTYYAAEPCVYYYHMTDTDECDWKNMLSNMRKIKFKNR